ncbi:hypothetical protein [Anabaena subtropica]|uniref:Uncharacterized protein n=1 Tax=Anabaena subtropica FACHB-260 TaxID=2692884 RepID=A0ABR8CR48_9NOST|nr:hypothetical protein [Anabaena subtropica]MBD2345409.1 hypothetical protein [Anabaena subtropica FACHB-260]
MAAHITENEAIIHLHLMSHSLRWSLANFYPEAVCLKSACLLGFRVTEALVFQVTSVKCEARLIPFFVLDWG